MTEVLEEARRAIEGRLDELNEERSRLEAAAAALSPNGHAAPRRRARRAGGRRRGSGTRGVEAAEIVGAHPDGISVAAIAKAMNIQPNYLYRVLPQLQREGKVRKRGKVWLPA